MNTPVSLQEMLDAREHRAVLRQTFFQSSNLGESLLQITVNIPGAIKNSPMVRNIYSEALRCLTEVLPGTKLLPVSSGTKKTGPEGYLRLSLPSHEVKRITCHLEMSHILGRLWDLDVFTDQNHSVSRSDLGLEGRRCYLCERPAHECSRSKRHSPDEISRHIKELYRLYSDKKKPWVSFFTYLCI